MAGRVGSLVAWKAITVEWTCSSRNRLDVHDNVVELRKLEDRICCTMALATSREVFDQRTALNAASRTIGGPIIGSDGFNPPGSEKPRISDTFMRAD